MASVEGVQGGVAGRRVTPALGRKHGQPAGLHLRDRKTSTGKTVNKPTFRCPSLCREAHFVSGGTAEHRGGAAGRTRADAMESWGLSKAPEDRPTGPGPRQGPHALSELVACC